MVPPDKLIVGKMELYVFVNKWFDISLFLIDKFEHPVLGLVIPLKCTVHYKDQSNQELAPYLYDIDSTSLVVNKQGTARVSVKINQILTNASSKKLAIQFWIEDDRFKVSKIASCTTFGFECVRYKLKLHTNLQEQSSSILNGTALHEPSSALDLLRHQYEESDTKVLPYVWYKDEKGRENCIELYVRLVGENNEIIKDRIIPLKVSLLYSDGSPVVQSNNLKSDLLTCLPDSEMKIQRNGVALIKLRINDVSKNHQRRMFSIGVTPDTTALPLLHEISGDYTRPIEVKSKRTKKLNANVIKDEMTVTSHPREASRDYVTMYSTGPSQVLQQSNYDNRMTTFHPKSALNHPPDNSDSKLISLTHLAWQLEESIHGGSSSSKGRITPPIEASLQIVHPMSNHVNSSLPLPHSIHSGVQSSPLQEDPKVMIKSSEYPDLLRTHIDSHHWSTTGSNGITADPTPLHSIDNKKVSNINGFHSIRDTNPMQGGTPPAISLSNAMDNIIEWTSQVIKGLKEIYWKPIGFERKHPNGESDYEKPLFSIHNPNPIINEILNQYSATVFENLQYVVKHQQQRQHPTPSSNHAQHLADSIPFDDTNEMNQKRKWIKTNRSFQTLDDNLYSITPVEEQRMHIENNYFLSDSQNPMTETAHYDVKPSSIQNDLKSLIKHVQNYEDSEANVFYIIAVPYPYKQKGYLINNPTFSSSTTPDEVVTTQSCFSAHPESGNKVELGFPAYDIQFNLIGFYFEDLQLLKGRESSGNDFSSGMGAAGVGQTVIKFLPIYSRQLYDIFLLENATFNLHKARAFIDHHIETNSPALYSLARMNVESNGIEAMKQDALIYYWLSEVDLDADMF